MSNPHPAHATLAYWCEALAGLPEEIDVPGLRRAGGTAGAADTSAVSVVSRADLDPELSAALARLAGAAGGDLLTALRAGVVVLLARLGAGDDLPLGAVLGTGDPVVVRIAVPEGASFRALVAAVHAAEQAASQNTVVRYEEVARAVNAARQTPGQPLFRIGVAPDEERVTAALRLEGRSVWFALEDSGVPDPARNPDRIRLTHAAASLDPAAARSWCDRLVHLLAAAAGEPDVPVTSLSPLLPGEASALLAAGIGPAAEPAAASIVSWFERGVGQWPDEVAVVGDDVSLTYAELNERADRLADVLVRQGVGTERIVGVVLPRSAGWVVAFLSVLKAGGVYLPVDVGLPVNRVSMMLQDADPAVVLTDGRTIEGWTGRELSVTSDGRCPQDDSAPDAGSARRTAGVSGEQAVYMLYTSGSTGLPKGALMSDQALVNLLSWHLAEVPTGPGRIIAQFTSPGFDISVQELLAALLTGALLALPPDDVRNSPYQLAAWLDEQRVTDFYAPNLVLELTCRAALEQGRTLPHLGHISQSGEALSPGKAMREIFHIMPGRTLHNLYGPVETHGLAACTLPADVSDWPTPVPIGRPLDRTRIYVLDDDLQLVPPGVTGELFATSDCLARGYHSRPALAAERFLPNPFGPPGSRMYRTGDLVRWHPDGALDYRGRADHQVKIRGMRLELGEIEALARQVPQIRDVVTVATGADDHRRLDAYLVPVPGADPAEVVATVQRQLESELPAAFVPATFTILDELPLNANKKIDRKALPAPELTRSGVLTPPRTPQEIQLAELYAEVLHRTSVGIHDDFFELGGNSLLAADLAVRVRKTMEVEAGLGEIFRNPSVARLAESLQLAEPARPAIRAGAGGSRPPASFAQRGLWILDQIEGAGAGYNEPVVLRLEGPLDKSALRKAFVDVVARHETLHTILRLSGEEIRQEPQAHSSAEFKEISVSAEDLERALTDTARRAFDLEVELPIRALLCELAADSHRLLLVTHHVACDGASVEPMLRDLAVAYNARLRGSEPDWAPLPVSYGDYAAWQHELFGSRNRSGLAMRQIEYWSKQLSGLPEAIPLPGGRARPAARDGVGAAIDLDVPAATHARLAEVARRSRATSFMVVHAALAALLTDLGCGTDIVIGAVVSGRDDDVLEQLVGHFVNTLVLRVDTAAASAALPFAELLDRVRETDLGALAHRELPFEHVVELVNPKRSLSHQPVVQIMLAYQMAEVEPPVMRGLVVSQGRVDLGAATFDLCFTMSERFAGDGSPQGITGALEYAVDAFSPQDAQSIATAFLEQLGHVAPPAE
ncbi:amino acid adenylation domain-containing protein [Catenulispora sp. GAS73]|uniref:amino acid adenylation domain-containing protein n=1 Tax=Catenulispora sp. GAS73 TaxID=3156269 RepID=UPI00351519D3